MVLRRAPAPVDSKLSASSLTASEAVRLNKRMAELGLASRREADEWIEKGWVRINGDVAEVGMKVLPADKITIERAATRAQEQSVTILLNKPIGYVSGQAEDGHKPASVLVTPQAQWPGDRSGMKFSRQHFSGLAPAGRLDIDSTGLLVLTQDGRIARNLIGDDSDIEKEYLVRVRWGDRDRDIASGFPQGQLARLRFGLSLDGQALRQAQVNWQNPEQLRFVLREGKKRQIRRMCEAVGLQVVALRRIRIGRVLLGDLPIGQYRYLARGEAF